MNIKEWSDLHGEQGNDERKDPGADPDCPYCHGQGYVIDWVPVPFGHGNCQMRTGCECLENTP